MAVCRSCPQACICARHATVELLPRLLGDGQGVHVSTQEYGRPSDEPRITAVTDVEEVPSLTSTGRPSSASSTSCWVAGRSSPISGCWCSRRRSWTRPGPSACASSCRALSTDMKFPPVVVTESGQARAAQPGSGEAAARSRARSARLVRIARGSGIGAEASRAFVYGWVGFS